MPLRPRVPAPRRLAALAAVVALSLAVAAPAQAESASVSTGVLTVTASPGETNNVTITPVGGALEVVDPGAGLSAGAGCTLLSSPMRVSCPSSGLTALSISLGDLGDRLSSTSSLNTTVFGGVGDDYLTTGGGNDTLNGDAGQDWVDGGSGNDNLSGGADADVLWYGSHATAVTATIPNRGGAAAAEAVGGGETDTVQADFEAALGGSGNDTLTGSGGGDYLAGGAGNDAITGGGGADYVGYWERSTGVSVTLGAVGQASCGNGGPGENDCVAGDVQNIFGSDGNDTLVGNDGPNVILGDWLGAGNDTLQGRGGADALYGDGGVDTVSYAEKTPGVNVSLDAAANDGTPGENDLVAGDVENVLGGAGADTMTGGAGSNILSGGPGNDTLSGLGADDTLDGGTGADTTNGGSGVDTASYADRGQDITATIGGGAVSGAAGEGDTIAADLENLTGGAGADVLTGDAGANRLLGGAGDDTLVGRLGADQLEGDAGRDVASYAERTNPVTVTVDGTAQDGESGEGDLVASDVEGVTGGAGADVINGGSADNTLSGGPGDDALNGQGGNDLLDGGQGADDLTGGPGEDRATYAGRAAPVHLTLDGQPDDGAAGENDNVQADIEDVTGGDGADTVFGSGADNRLDGGPGADALDGGPGVDALSGGAGDDALSSRDGVAEPLDCGAGADSARTDPSDATVGCESVDDGTPAPPGPSPSPPPSQPPPSEPVPAEPAPAPPSDSDEPPVLTVTVVRAPMNTDGTVRVAVSCPAGQTARCTGVARLELAPARASKKRGRTRRALARPAAARRVLGSARFSVAPGTTRAVPVKLSRDGRRRVIKARGLTCRLAVTAKAPDGTTRTTRSTFTVTPPASPRRSPR